jgi:hypothetical protein
MHSMKQAVCSNIRAVIVLSTAIALHCPVLSHAATTYKGKSVQGNVLGTTTGEAPAASGDVLLPSQASGVASIAATGTPGRTYEVPLSQLLGEAEPMTLKGPAPEILLPLQLPALLEPSDVVLNLSGSASHSLLPSSQLVVKANGRVVDQIGLRDDNSSFRRAIVIPRAALKAGMNDVRLVGAQRSSPTQTTCDADTAPELWTQLDLRQSNFVINARSKNVPARLDALDVLFDKSTLQATPVIPFFTADKPNADEIKALGITAQGLARRYGDVPMKIVYDTLPANPGNLASLLPKDTPGGVVMGTFAQMAPYLVGLNLPAKSGPIMAVRQLPGDSTRFVLVMAADSAADLTQVATAFSVPGMPLPDQPWMQVSHLEMPGTENAQRVIAAPADSSGNFPLRALQYRTTTSTGKHAPETKLKFWNNNWQGRLLVQVHLSYASGMAPQSALNVLTNGVLHGSIPLNSPAGGSYFNYAVTIPSGSMKLGWNTLQFQPVLVPDGTGQGCKPQAEESLAVTLYDDTTVQKYEGVSSKLPDLALLSGIGHAYIDNKTTTQTAVHLADTDPQTIGAGLTLLAKLSQVQHGPLQPAWFGIGENTSMQNHIWVGVNTRLPGYVKQAAATNQPQEVTVRLPLVQSSLVSPPTENGWLSNLKDTLGFTEEKEPTSSSAKLNIASPSGNKSYAYTSRANGMTTTVFTAENASALASGMASVTAPHQWDQLRGSFASWTPGADSVSAVSAEEAPFQAYGLRGGFAMLISRYPWLALVALGLAIVLLVPVTARVLRNYRKRNHGPHEK